MYRVRANDTTPPSNPPSSPAIRIDVVTPGGVCGDGAFGVGVVTRTSKIGGLGSRYLCLSVRKPLNPTLQGAAFLRHAQRLVPQRLEVPARTLPHPAREEVRAAALARHDAVVRVERQ